jgi:anti-sigma B factor antagonist
MAVRLTEDRREGGIAVLRVDGRLDAAAAGDFEAGILPLAGDAGVTRLILACGELEYVASAGLRVLVKVVKSLAARKAKLYCAELRPEPLSVLKMTGFLSFMAVKQTLDECLG